MTLASTNEAIGGKKHAEKNLFKGEKIPHDPGGHARCKNSITTKCKIFWD
jgi:hypothetical protein